MILCSQLLGTVYHGLVILSGICFSQGSVVLVRVWEERSHCWLVAAWFGGGRVGGITVDFRVCVLLFWW